jgi:hypothetical protein
MHFIVYSEHKNSCIYCAEYTIRRIKIAEYKNTYSVICCVECSKNNIDNIRYLLLNQKSEEEYNNEVKYWKKECGFYKKEYEYYKREYEKSLNVKVTKPTKKDLFS